VQSAGIAWDVRCVIEKRKAVRNDEGIRSYCWMDYRVGYFLDNYCGVSLSCLLVFFVAIQFVVGNGNMVDIVLG
jgi:hypothetical protein